MTGWELLDVEGVDELYTLQREEFVSARNRLVKQLRATGDRDDAAAVKKLRRPTVVAWALNQVARAQPDMVDELVEAGSAVQRAQTAAIGSGDPGDLRAAAQRRRQIVSDLARSAAELAGSTHHDEAVATLDAASVEDDVAALLRHGRLTKDVPPPSGFGMAAIAQPAGGLSRPERRRAELERLRRDLERAEDAVVAAEENAARADERLTAAEADAEAAQGELDRARGDRDRSRAALAEAESV